MIQADGQAVVAGSVQVVGSNYDFAVLRLLGVPLFVDGFESGDTSAWAATVP